MTGLPEPPPLDAATVRDLVAYAEHVAEHLEREITEAEARGLDTAPLPRLVEGWRFVATAIAESYDGRG